MDYRDKTELLALPTRKRIYDHIERTPGIHLRQLQKDLTIPLGTLEYHLRQLERGEVITTLREGRYKAHFVRNEFDPVDRRFLYYLRRPMPRRIVQEILADYDVTRARLLERLPIRSSTLSHHLRRLVQGEILQPFWVDGRKIYVITDVERARRLLATYGPTFGPYTPPVASTPENLASTEPPTMVGAGFAMLDGSGGK